MRSLFAALAPVARAGMRPCTPLKPCDCLRKHAVVFDEHPIPLIFAARCGGTSSSQSACTSAAVTESWPHPAQSVDIAPSYSRLVSPSEFLGSDGCRTGGLVIDAMSVRLRSVAGVVILRERSERGSAVS